MMLPCTAGLQGRVLAKSMAAAILCLLLQYPLSNALFFCSTLYSLKYFTLDHQNFRKTKRFSLFTGWKILFHYFTYGKVSDCPCFNYLQFEDLPRGSPYRERTTYFRLSEEKKSKMMFIENLHRTWLFKYVTLLNSDNNCLRVALLFPYYE